MANVAISGMALVSSLADDDEIEIRRGSTTRKVTGAALKAAFRLTDLFYDPAEGAVMKQVTEADGTPVGSPEEVVTVTTLLNPDTPNTRRITITPSDVTVLNPRPRAIYLPDGGTLAMEDADGNVVTKTFAAGESWRDFAPSRIRATGTSVTGEIVGFVP